MTHDNTNAPLTAEQLQAELDAAKKEIRDLRDELTATQFNLYDYASDERLKRQMTDYQAADLRAALAAATARAESAEAERDRLRAALKPFAEYSKVISASIPEYLAMYAKNGVEITVGDFRRAADALAGDGEAGA